jgi:hypothetical protein
MQVLPDKQTSSNLLNGLPAEGMAGSLAVALYGILITHLQKALPVVLTK